MSNALSETYPLERPPTVAAGVPHRFGVGVLMLLVTFVALVCGLLTSYGVTPETFVVVVVLVVGVAAGQSLLFGGEKPREASFFVGMVLFPLELLGVGVYRDFAGVEPGHGFDFFGTGLLCGLTAGGPVGYAAGCVTSGVFLFVNWWNSRGRCDLPAVALRPFAESDIDVLLRWVREPQLRARWSRCVFPEPVGRKEIQQHLQQATGPEPTLLAWMAVVGDTERPVGYVELRDIDRERQSATVDLALVAPDEPDRGRLSIALLRALLELAFAEMRLERVQVFVPAYDPEPEGCYRAMGCASEALLRGSLPRGKGRTDERILSRLRHEWFTSQRTRYGRVRPKTPDPNSIEADG